MTVTLDATPDPERRKAVEERLSETNTGRAPIEDHPPGEREHILIKDL